MVGLEPLDGLDAEAGQFIPCEGGRRLLIRERFDGLPATSVNDANEPLVADFDHVDDGGFVGMGLIAEKMHRLGPL